MRIKQEFLYLHPASEAVKFISKIAQMAELVDALDSKSCFGNGVQVRFLFWALDYQSFRKVHESEPFLFANNLQTIPYQFANK